MNHLEAFLKPEAKGGITQAQGPQQGGSALTLHLWKQVVAPFSAAVHKQVTQPG